MLLHPFCSILLFHTAPFCFIQPTPVGQCLSSSSSSHRLKIREWLVFLHLVILDVQHGAEMGLCGITHDLGAAAVESTNVWAADFGAAVEGTSV
jgi:hypothetical protein